MTTTADSDADTTENDAPPGEPGGGSGVGRLYAWTLVVTGFLGLLASWVITLDKFRMLEDAGFEPGCSINAVMSCGNIMESDQASAFGFPNPMLGLATYGAVVAIGMGAVAGARYHRWFWLGLQGGTLFGVVFCTWLMWQSLYTIGALCLWCCLAWMATIVMFWATTVHNVRHRFLPLPEGVRRALLEFPWLPTALHLGIVVILVWTRWGSALWGA